MHVKQTSEGDRKPMLPDDPVERGKCLAGYAACEGLREGMRIGLGTGSTAYYAIERVGQLVAEGLQIQAVATSERTVELAKQFKIPLLDVQDVTRLDRAIDGVDEIDPQFHAIKGGGGALFREKVVANLADEVIWVMDDRKPVPALGRFPLPVEIVPFAAVQVVGELSARGLYPRLRWGSEAKARGFSWSSQRPSLHEQWAVLRQECAREALYRTDNGNWIVDLVLEPPINVEVLEPQLLAIIGVVETGIFPNFCDRILVGTGEGSLRELKNPKTPSRSKPLISFTEAAEQAQRAGRKDQ